MDQTFTIDHFRAILADSRSIKAKPGVSDPDALERDISIIDAMNDEDRRNPDQIDGASLQRIASAAGAEQADVEHLLSLFAQMQDTFRQISGLSWWQRLKLILGFK